MAFLSVMPNLYVADVERAAAFYRDQLGAVETFRIWPVFRDDHRPPVS
jgi:catechol 2,3-dioxygenase-like lactoylglutathione lyase family enzyme